MNENVIARVISLPGGHSVELFGLHVYRLENNEFAVEYIDEDVQGKKKNRVFHEEFKNAHDAASCFEAKRKEWKIGFDYEVAQ